jgi:hypothetical protein
MLSLAARRLTVVLAAAFVSSVAIAADPTMPTQSSEPVQVEQKPIVKNHVAGGKKASRKSSKKSATKKTRKHHKLTSKSAVQ